MILFRRYIGLILAAAILVTGHSALAGRFARDATGQVVLCTGSGPVSVRVDEDGNPTGPPHFCPDCITHLLDLVQDRTAAPAPCGALRQAIYPAPRAQWCVASERSARARAPPQV
ncbi:hypothetical protein [Phaeobacter sp. B1627]|uniref:hypothetical protein n=1 Tax=Phaeobacter sp. B1627 TaxID=2583809 RepID=UPI001117C5BA|nr:hypothetical protein [Phaeobacter sp. B1627]TNJ48549.1 hypothetical protein FGE21_00955 [Phaeobacter sp. B1627]